MKHLLFIVLLSYWLSPVRGQSFYYVRQDVNSNYYLGIFDLKTCKDSIILTINTLNVPNLTSIRDIAISPIGDIYLSVTASGDRYIVRLDMLTNTLNIITNLPYPCSSLTCDGNGVLYAASGFGLFTYDLASGVGVDHGPVNFQPAGDLTFRDGKLYCTTALNDLVEVNIQNPDMSQVVFTYQLPSHLLAWGVVSFVESCDSTTTYITVTKVNDIGGPIYSINQVYSVDITNQSVDFICDTPGPILGAATPNEFLASDCSIRLDLDADNSSGAPDSNYLALPLCPGSSLVAAADTDATFYSGYRVDSIRARLLSPAPDAPLEYLTAQAPGSVSVAGQGTSWLTLSATPNTALPVANADFQNALRSLQWHNDAMPFTPGPRTVEVVAFASNGLRDTAYAFIPVPQPVNAGRDTSLALCADTAPFDLASVLETGISSGGIWSPPTSAGNSVFSPQNDADGVYNYLVSNGVCPADTAVVSVNVLPLPVFSLGNDTAFCAGETLTLAAPGIAIWQDGTSALTYTLDQSGLYWAELTAPNGCRWRDSVAISVNQPTVSQLFATSCFGKPYVWNSQSFTSDTSVCTTYTAANGCDSLNCLNLTFFYLYLSLDTSACSGQTLSWLGQTFSQPGLYLDTLLYNGCLHAVTVNLALQPPDTTQVAATICDGESYNLGGQTFSVAGQYAVTFQTAQGCDSVALLSLTVQQPAQVEIAAGLCPGGTYVFGNQVLGLPGIYQDTFGCDSVVTLTLSLLPAPQPQITGAAAVCPGAEATLTVDGGFDAYEWPDGSTGFSFDAGAGEHSVTVTDANGCTGADTFFVAEIPPVKAVWDTASPLCHGSADGFIELSGISGGTEPFVFQLNNGAPSGSASFQNLIAGMWEVLVTDGAGCQTAFSFTLSDPPALMADLGNSQQLVEGESYLIPVQINQQGQFTYTWSPPLGLSCNDCSSPVATPLETTVYRLFLENENGCTTSDSVTLRVLAAAPQIYAPNIFSPNEDGINDFFILFSDPEDFSHIESLQIYDRWGGLMFEGRTLALNNEQQGWDGTWRGMKMPPGVYTWLAEIKLANGDSIEKSGEMTIVR
ncbi:MAG: hypothetical protein OHK0019_19330 [Saprospiraceae bacterium]